MTITLKTSEKTKNMMIDFYNDLKREKTPQYAVFQAVDGDTVVTLYESGKAVFQGKDADLASDYWIETEKINSGYATVTNSEKKKKEPIECDEKKEATKYLYTTTYFYTKWWILYRSCSKSGKLSTFPHPIIAKKQEFCVAQPQN